MENSRTKQRKEQSGAAVVEAAEKWLCANKN